MKMTSAAALAAGIGAICAAAPANSQYGSAAAPPQTAQQPAQQQPPAKVTPSRGALKAIVELQTAVNAKDAAAIPVKLAAAQAAARTKEDRYIIAQLQLQTALAGNDNGAIAAAIDAIAASGYLDAAKTAELYLGLATTLSKEQQWDGAAAAYERAAALNPGNAEIKVMLGETRNAQGRTAEAVALLQAAIAQVDASGAKANETWYKRALALSYNARLAPTAQISHDWVRAYPTTENWRESLRIYRNLAQPESALLLDTLRLQRAAGALDDDAEIYNHAYLAINDRFPGEAKQVLDEGFASGKVSRSERRFAEIYTDATAPAERSRAYLAEGARDALADPQARLSVRSGDAHYGFGDYAKAAEMYRAGLAKTGADADLINLRLGAALARSGDRAGATAAFNLVTGPRAELAKYWLLYLETRI